MRVEGSRAENKKAVMKQHADLSWGLLCSLCRTSQSSAKTDIAITEETAQ